MPFFLQLLRNQQPFYIIIYKPRETQIMCLCLFGYKNGFSLYAEKIINVGGGMGSFIPLWDCDHVICLSVDKNPPGIADGKQNETEEREVEVLKTNHSQDLRTPGTHLILISGWLKNKPLERNTAQHL